MLVPVHTHTVLLNIMFHALMGRFLLELIYYFTYFSTVIPTNIYVVLSCKEMLDGTTVEK